MTGATTPEGAARPPRKGLLDWVMVKADGSWLIAVMHKHGIERASDSRPGQVMLTKANRIVGFRQAT